jgi:hypothetical protein
MSDFDEQAQSTCACGGSCGCGSAHQETYLTREEYVAELEKYLVRLRQEIESVEMELAQLSQPAQA